jgi:hypothetical protein
VVVDGDDRAVRTQRTAAVGSDRAVVVGHVDGMKQKGIFYRLKEIRPTNQVLVSRKDGTELTFVVSRAEQIDKDEFPTEAVYGDTADSEVRLITCGGSFDRSVHSYRDNIIVYATLESWRKD